MVNILLASHSKKLVEGLREIITQMTPNINLKISGGDIDGNLGSNFEEIYKIIDELSSDDGLIIFFDLGSSMMNCQMAIEMLDIDKRSKVYLSGAPMIEYSVQTAVEASTGARFDDLVETLEAIQFNKLNM